MCERPNVLYYTCNYTNMVPGKYMSVCQVKSYPYILESTVPGCHVDSYQYIFESTEQYFSYAFAAVHFGLDAPSLGWQSHLVHYCDLQSIMCAKMLRISFNKINQQILCTWGKSIIFYIVLKFWLISCNFNFDSLHWSSVILSNCKKKSNFENIVSALLIISNEFV